MHQNLFYLPELIDLSIDDYVFYVIPKWSWLAID